MPTLITHALVGGATAQATRPGWPRWKFAAAAVVCSVLPDFDVVGFRLGIHYGDLWGHRGLTHSLVFALVIGGAIGFFFGDNWRERWKSALLLFLVMASHDVLDAFTSGGLGIAFFAPFSNQRYFFPWTDSRFTAWTAQVLFRARRAGDVERDPLRVASDRNQLSSCDRLAASESTQF